MLLKSQARPNMQKIIICFISLLYLSGCQGGNVKNSETQSSEAAETSFVADISSHRFVSYDVFRKILLKEQPQKSFQDEIKQIHTYKWITENNDRNAIIKEVNGRFFKKAPSTVTYSKQGKKLIEANTNYSWEMFYHYNEDGNLICRTVKNSSYTEYDYTIFDVNQLPVQRVKYSVSDDGEITLNNFEEIVYLMDNERYTIKGSEYSGEYVLSAKTSKSYDDQMRILEWDRDLQYTRMNTIWNYGGQHITEKNDKENMANFRYEKTLNEDGSLNNVKQFDDDDECRNITTYRYYDDKTEATSQNYSYNQSYKGDYTQEVTDKNGLFLLKIYKDANGDGYHRKFEYDFDEKGNWITKRELYASYNKHSLQESHLSDIEIREIIYYEKGEKEVERPLPSLPKKIKELSNKLPQLIRNKQQDIDNYNNALENGEYDTEIIVKSAHNLDDFTPRLWEVEITRTGDLDKDGDDDAVIVYRTPIGDDMGQQRTLGIFRNTNNGWELWEQNSSVVLSTQSGGVWGDGFEGIDIRRGTIVINHFGGSRDKWVYTSIFRFQNDDWFLIGSSNSSFAGGEYSISSDYNLSTGQINYTEERWNMMNENAEGPEKLIKETFTHKLPELPKMKDYQLMQNTLNFDDITIDY